METKKSDAFSPGQTATFEESAKESLSDSQLRRNLGKATQTIRNKRAVAVEGDPDHPVNRGRLCPKGLSEHLTLAAPGRLTHPTVDGRRATWDQALDRVASGFRRLVDDHGPESVAVLSTGQLVTEEFYALGKLVRLGMGVRHFDGNTTLCMASAVSGYKLSFGSDGPPGAYDDFAMADVVLLVNRSERGATYVMPDVIGLDGSRAADLLRGWGFRPRVVRPYPYPGMPPPTGRRRWPARIPGPPPRRLPMRTSRRPRRLPRRRLGGR